MLLDSWNFSFFVVACSQKLLSLLQEWSAPAGNLLFLRTWRRFLSSLLESLKESKGTVALYGIGWERV